MHNVSHNMVRKIFKTMYPPEQVEEPPQPPKSTRYVAKYNFEIIHADVHYYHKLLQNYLYALIDDRSRYLLDYQIFLAQNRCKYLGSNRTMFAKVSDTSRCILTR